MSERKVVRKWIWAWEFEEEEQWLNQMAAAGWVLDQVGFCRYEFIRCEPDEYTVRLEMRDKDDAYVAFMEETGAEYIGRMMKWIYFRKKASDGAFDIFSDMESRVKHIDQIITICKGGAVANLVVGVANSLNPMLHIGWLNLLCATLLAYGWGRLQGKREALKKEQMLHE